MLRTLTFSLTLGLLACKGAPTTDLRKPYKPAQGAIDSDAKPDSKADRSAGDSPEQTGPITPDDKPEQTIEDGDEMELPKPIDTIPDQKDPEDDVRTDPPPFCVKLDKSGDWASKKAFYGPNGKLTYPEDAQKNRIPDFSYAGYRYGEVEPPHYPAVATIKPIAGDNTAAIQKALDELAKSTPNAQGVRGALLLAPGRYEVRGTLYVKADGMVLRGSGDGDDPAKDTILWGRGNVPHQRTIIILGSNSNSAFVATGTAEEITDEWVSVGSQSVKVKDASRFKVGDWVQIKHPSTANWLKAINGGGMKADAAWTTGSTDILYNRRILKIQGNALSFDAPIYNHLDRKLAISTVSALKSPSVVKESGIENLRVDIETAGGEDENHAWNAIAVTGAEDSWVRGISALHFGQAGVVTKQAIRITIDRARTSDPVGIRTGERFYNFNAAAMSQLILIKNCFAKDGRHNFISNGVQTSSGLVFHRCTIEGDSDSEGHRRWTTGMLFDSVEEKGGKGGILLYNRQDYGTSHGWAAAHSVVWNYNGFMTIQQPPTAQNYAISSGGRKKGSPHAGNEGHIEIQSGKLFPSSLYEAQLCERLGH